MKFLGVTVLLAFGMTCLLMCIARVIWRPLVFLVWLAPLVAIALVWVVHLEQCRFVVTGPGSGYFPCDGPGQALGIALIVATSFGVAIAALASLPVAIWLVRIPDVFRHA